MWGSAILKNKNFNMLTYLCSNSALARNVVPKFHTNFIHTYILFLFSEFFLWSTTARIFFLFFFFGVVVVVVSFVSRRGRRWRGSFIRSATNSSNTNHTDNTNSINNNPLERINTLPMLSLPGGSRASQQFSKLNNIYTIL